jgi:Mg2+/Co2+ transporter CorB
VLIIWIILNAFFAASGIALISLNDNKVKMMAVNITAIATKDVKLQKFNNKEAVLNLIV